MKRTITNENFWTMDEKEFKECMDAIQSNGWGYYTYNSRFENCIDAYVTLMDAYGEYAHECEQEDDEPMSLEYYYYELAECMTCGE